MSARIIQDIVPQKKTPKKVIEPAVISTPIIKKEEPKRFFDDTKKIFGDKTDKHAEKYPEKLEEPKSIYPEKAQQTLPETPPARKPLFGGTSPSDDDSNDELDIPAFIRKKMK